MGRHQVFHADTDARPRKLSVDDLFAMVEAGILQEGERVELFDGVLLETNAKNIRHETARTKLTNALTRALPETYLVGSELGSRFAEDVYFEPDIIVVDASVPLDQLNPDTVPLVIEISDTTLAYDAGAKRDRYAALGLPEYWVIDVNNDTLTVHRAPEGGEYTDQMTQALDQTVTPAFSPALSLNIADIVS